MDYTEAMLRREIAKIPDGDYTAEGFLDDDGRTRGVHLPVKVTVEEARRRRGGRSHRLGRAIANCVQCSFRGIDQGSMLFRIPCAVARHLYA